jgi:hypothetical protein
MERENWLTRLKQSGAEPCPEAAASSSHAHTFLLSYLF